MFLVLFISFVSIPGMCSFWKNWVDGSKSLGPTPHEDMKSLQEPTFPEPQRHQGHHMVSTRWSSLLARATECTRWKWLLGPFAPTYSCWRWGHEPWRQKVKPTSMWEWPLWADSPGPRDVPGGARAQNLQRGSPRHHTLVRAEHVATTLFTFPWIPARPADLWDPEETQSKSQAAKR